MSLKIFFCYAHEDENLLNKLKAQLKPLQLQNLIDNFWYDRDIKAGTEWEKEIIARLDDADVILLMVSPDFMASDYCYGVELKRALERHRRGEALVIPVILRPVYWQGVLGMLQALPTDGKPVAGSEWFNQDEAFFSVAEGIRKIAEEMTMPTRSSSAPLALKPPVSPEEITLLRTFIGHTDPVYSVCFSPIDSLLASGSNKVIKLWNTNTGSLVDTIEQHTNIISSVAFSPTGKIFASGSFDGSIKLWDAQTHRLLHSLNIIQNRNVSCIAFSPDGQTLVSGSYDQKIRIWDVQSGNLMITLDGSHETIYSVAFSPSDFVIVSGSNKSIKFWDSRSGKLIDTLEEQETFYSLIFSSNGQMLASGSNKAIKLRDSYTKETLCTLDIHSGLVYSIAFRPDEQILVCSNQNLMNVWNPHTGKLLASLNGHTARVSSVSFSPDGQILASGSHDRTIKLWGKRY